MIRNILKTKLGSSIAVATAITMATTVGVASAHHSSWRLADAHDTGDTSGYSKDDCKNGGWQTNFPPGTFKNQGECVAFFTSHHHGHDGNNNHGNKHHHWWDDLAFWFWHGHHWNWFGNWFGNGH